MVYAGVFQYCINNAQTLSKGKLIMPTNFDDIKSTFIDFIITREVLKFGDFKLKSGRQSPYFFDFSRLSTGKDFIKLGQFYSALFMHSKFVVDYLIGPAYKGILATETTAITLASDHNIDLPCVFIRKEQKNHGETGILIGPTPPKGSRCLIIDDVLSAGTAVNNTASTLEQYGVKIAGILVALDRQEIALDDKNMLSTENLQKKFSAPVVSIITLNDIINWLENYAKDDSRLLKKSMQTYQRQYGIPKIPTFDYLANS